MTEPSAVRPVKRQPCCVVASSHNRPVLEDQKGARGNYSAETPYTLLFDTATEWGFIRNRFALHVRSDITVGN